MVLENPRGQGLSSRTTSLLDTSDADSRVTTALQLVNALSTPFKSQVAASENGKKSFEVSTTKVNSQLDTHALNGQLIEKDPEPGPPTVSHPRSPGVATDTRAAGLDLTLHGPWNYTSARPDPT